MCATVLSPIKLRASLKNTAILSAAFQPHERESIQMKNVLRKDLEKCHKIT